MLMLRNKTKTFWISGVAPAVLFTTFATSAGGAGAGFTGPLSSSFPGPFWTVVAPVGGTASVANAHLTLTVPGGSNHDALRPSNQSLRVVQPIGNFNFDVSIKIDSAITAAANGTSQGLMALNSTQNFVSFAITTDGTHISLNAQTVTAGVAKVVFSQVNFNEYQNPICLRLARQANTYTAYYSPDGVVWTQAATFNYTPVPNLIGPFAGNYSAIPAQAAPVSMAINWFKVQ
jgi:hypothetical protein